MKSKVHITQPLVSVSWLAAHLEAPNLVILHASLKKVTADTPSVERIGLKNARLFDIKNTFSDTTSLLPNTMLSAEKFQEQAQLLGINQDTAIVVYDTIGVYSSPRVWWMFKAMGHSNIAVLNGGLPEWIQSGYETAELEITEYQKGDFIANYDPGSFVDTTDVLKAISDPKVRIADARSSDRFMGLVDEPREGLRAGHIPGSKNLPYTVLQEEGKMLSKEKLSAIFDVDYNKKNKVMFSCGSGITACILALGAEIAAIENLAVYDGSWTEWGSDHKLPIQKK